ncbi:YwqH-like family protein [Guptibacillus hwajinpoensis]|uniref:YwqH-like family protein n=1 Tax=Guptibacillus hwajinpoensis TaxID=208199 RepID=UPI001CD80EF9|nr:DUF5082 family protein [Pseudalkalibacillus hwajinpoensis]MCA0993821.1 DUF5082 domain-containing protein [Pseudalkalibacillus hwajinpoensis]
MSYLFQLQSNLAEKREQLARLETCTRKLDSIQDEFIHNRHLVDDPELTPSTWHGTLADSFKNIRDDMKEAYNDISTSQLNSVQSTLEDKVTRLRIEIGMIESSISHEKQRLANEEKERKSVK